jgi:hypothetical protein
MFAGWLRQYAVAATSLRGEESSGGRSREGADPLQRSDEVGEESVAGGEAEDEPATTRSGSASAWTSMFAGWLRQYAVAATSLRGEESSGGRSREGADPLQRSSRSWASSGAR